MLPFRSFKLFDKNVASYFYLFRNNSNLSKISHNSKYCMESVKTNDYDAYMSTLVGPKKVLRAAFAIRALNIELLSIPKYNRELNVSIAKVNKLKKII